MPLPSLPPPTSGELFRRVLVANRGEIALRIMRTLRAMGISPAAVYSDPDAAAPHVGAADIAVHIGPAPAAQSYLSVARIIEAAHRVGAQAIHPGYGFLSENPALARACAEAGIVFIGPPASAIEAMGDKISARHIVASHGVAVVPGCDDPGLEPGAARAAALSVGLPVLLKPSAGGGGKGMRLVTEIDQLDDEIAAARREARRSFGDETMLIEHYVAAPRHIEIQVAADAFGNVVHLGERECSLQRRHQKIIEESPSPFVSEAMRDAMGAQACAAARACGYTNIGTVEMIVSAQRPDEFFFMEMNTRLQVEHAVTEMVHDIDLVEWQIRIAAGQSLPLTQQQLAPHGHAIEARVYAEDPARGFLPTGGHILALHEPHGPGVRVDSGMRAGLTVGSDYDPMLAKIICHAPDRLGALARLDAALGDTAVLGVTTNIAFLRELLADPDVVAGRLDTELVERVHGSPIGQPAPTAAIAAAAVLSLGRTGKGDPWDEVDGWRFGGHASISMRVGPPDNEQLVSLHRGPDRWSVRIDDGEPFEAIVERVNDAGARDAADRDAADRVAVSVDGCVERFVVATADDDSVWWLGAGGSAWRLPVQHRWQSAQRSSLDAVDGMVTSPMPGTVLEVRFAVGDHVQSGATVATVEAMKMEHRLLARATGTVAEVFATAGQTVALDAPVLRIDPTSEGEPR